MKDIKENMKETGETEMEPLKDAESGDMALCKEDGRMREGNKNASSLIVDEFDVNIPIIKRKKTVSVSDMEIPGRKETSSPVEKTIEKTERPEVKTEKPKKDRNEFTIRLSSEVKKRIPTGFSLDEIGMIDLQEAEMIANENILFLTESDLIEELDDIDLRPVRETAGQETQTEKEYQEVAVTVLEDEYDRETDYIHEEEEELQGAFEEETGETDIHYEEDLFDEPLMIPEENEIETPDSKDDSSIEEPGTGNIVEQMVLDQLDELVIEGEKEDVFLEGEKLSGPVIDENEIDEWQPVEETDLISSTGEKVISGSSRKEFDVEIYTSMMREVLPEEIRKIETISRDVSFIDDDLVEKEGEEKKTVFDENRLGSITLDLVEVSDREAVLLEEADPDSEHNRVAHSFLSFSKEYEDLQVEFEADEYRYRDDDLDFIDNTVFEDDYSRYIREIDDLYEIRKRKEITNAVEILGLNNGEIDFIEDRLYHDDYEDVNLDEIFNLIRFDSQGYDYTGGSERYCNYILPEAGSLLDDEKQSIEEDISARGALIFEENVNEIERKLGRHVSFEKAPAVEISEAVHDITDKILIIEDELDVDRFIREFPDEKQVDLKKLMKYLDGLFEKLPEDVVKNFADSEYFDIYVNVLNDMGV